MMRPSFMKFAAGQPAVQQFAQRRLLLSAMLGAIGMTSASRAFAAGQACPAPPAPQPDIQANTFYGDAAASVIDRQRLAQNLESTKSIERFTEMVGKQADNYLLAGSIEAAGCAGLMLKDWADGNAMLGNMSSGQAWYTRNWNTAGIALAYLKVQRALPASTRQPVEQWLRRLGLAVLSVLDDRTKAPKNNHLNWIGLVAGAVATACGDESIWASARRIHGQTMQQVETSGRLPLEARRGARALHYHHFALMPTVGLVELAALRGEAWDMIHSGAMHRLARLVLLGAADPANVSTVIGQPVLDPLTPAKLTWLGWYAPRFGDRIRDLPVPRQAWSERWLGGRVLPMNDAG